MLFCHMETSFMFFIYFFLNLSFLFTIGSQIWNNCVVLNKFDALQVSDILVGEILNYNSVLICFCSITEIPIFSV